MSRLGPFMHIIRFIVLLLAQGLIINHFDIHPNVHPMLYILFLLLLPIEWPAWLLMVIAFFYGLFMDAFTDTVGLHVSAMVFLAAVRPLVLRLFSPREGYEFGSEPGIHLLGARWFISYAAVCTFCHHFWFFMLEKFNFTDIGELFARTFLSTIATLVLLILVQYLFYNQKARN